MGALIGIIIFVVIVYLYILAIGWFFKYAAPFVFAIGSLAFIGLILVNYIRALVKGFLGELDASLNEAPAPPEPAFKNYFFKKAYLDYWDILKKAWGYNFEHGQYLFALNVAIVANGAWFLTWPLFVTLLAVFIVGAVAAAIFFLLFGILHLLIVSSVCASAYLAALYLRLIEWIAMLWRRVSFVCPHSGCYQKIALPVYICPTCGAKHRKLMPGAYGIFRRRCQCDQEKLPTAVLLGRRKLPSECPNCGKPLSSVIGAATNIHIPIVGGPATGKSSFLMASVIEITDGSQRSGRSVTFPEERDERTFTSNRELFKRGQPPFKTAELSPTAFLLQIAEPSGSEHLLYVYDAAGELYADSQDTRRLHEYFSDVDGILFLIDPFSIRQVALNYASQITAVRDQLKPSSESPQDVYDRLITTLRLFSKNSTIRSIPFAVVITKMDAFDLQGKASAHPRQWLLDQGEGNLLRSVENDFEQVQYFSSSALGHLPDGKTPFAPDGVLAPLQWTLSKREVKVTGTAEQGLSWKSEGVANAAGFAVATIAYIFAYFILEPLTFRITHASAAGNLAGFFHSAYMLLQRAVHLLLQPFLG
ncbi:MAG: hypothetical protein ABH878_08625 [bacterium]